MSVDKAVERASELSDWLDELEREQGDRGSVILESLELEHLYVELSNIREDLEV